MFGAAIWLLQTHRIARYLNNVKQNNNTATHVHGENRLLWKYARFVDAATAVHVVFIGIYILKLEYLPAIGYN